MPTEQGIDAATKRRDILTAGRQPTAVSRARRFVASRAVERLAELRENAELVVSELVTNVLVHTDSPVTVQVMVDTDCLRVEVHDECAVLPVGGILDRTAACGRGLVLVEQLTHRWGVTRVPGAGKSVWFELIAGVPTPADDLSADDLIDLWDDVEDAPLPTFDLLEPEGDDDLQTAAAEERRTVRIIGVPTHLLNGTRSHLDDLIRDLTLIMEAAAAGQPQDDDLLALGCRLSGLVVELGDFRNEIRRQGVEAAHQHAPSLTLEMALPTSLRGRLIEYRDALDEADVVCAEGRLLLPAPPPDHVEFRRWKLNRIIDQLRG